MSQMNEEVYKLNLQQLQYFLSAHHTRLSTYLGFVSALIGATVVGVLRTDSTFGNIVLCLGPILVIIVSTIGWYSCFRLYKKFLETITTLAKLEVELGLDQPRNRQGDWTATLPIVFSSHLKDRNDAGSDTEFVNNGKGHGEQRAAKYLFVSLQIIGLFLLMGLVGHAAKLY